LHNLQRVHASPISALIAASTSSVGASIATGTGTATDTGAGIGAGGCTGIGGGASDGAGFDRLCAFDCGFGLISSGTSSSGGIGSMSTSAWVGAARVRHRGSRLMPVIPSSA
jgi:hypothetical protein